MDAADETVVDEIGLDLLSDDELQATIERRIATLNRALLAQRKRRALDPDMYFVGYAGPRVVIAYDPTI